MCPHSTKRLLSRRCAPTKLGRARFPSFWRAHGGRGLCATRWILWRERSPTTAATERSISRTIPRSRWIKSGDRWKTPIVSPKLRQNRHQINKPQFAHTLQTPSSLHPKPAPVGAGGGPRVALEELAEIGDILIADGVTDL